MLMFLIVLHHAAFHGVWATDKSMWSLPVLFTLAIGWHVNGFVTISGWYGMKFSIAKFFKIFGVILFYSLIRFFIMFFFFDEPIKVSLRITPGWFGSVYLSFLFFVPLLNLAIDAVAKMERKQMLLIWAIFDIGIVLCWGPMSMISGFSWGIGGASMLTFCAIYVNARLVRHSDIISRIRPYHIILMVLVYVLFVVVFSVIPALLKLLRGYMLSQLDWIGFSTYNSPHNIVMGIAMFIMFLKFITVPSFICRVANKIGAYMFGVYLIHESTGVGRLLYKMPEAYFANHMSFPPPVVVFVVALFTFGICIVIDMIRSSFVKYIRMGIQMLQGRSRFLEKVHASR